VDVAHGNQPVEAPDGIAVAILNGEIYNHLSLRQELIDAGRPFRSHVDTEVILEGYLEWGIDGLLKRLDGMFAFAIHDRGSRRLLIARDRMGEKPLYISETYSDSEIKLVFASQLETVARHPHLRVRFNPDAVERFLAWGFVPGEQTLISGITKIMPGCVYEYDLDKFIGESRKYWLPSATTSPACRSFEDAVEQTRHLVDEAVISRTRSDVPVGVFLSGGLDSSIVVSCMARQTSMLSTFSVAFESSHLDERGKAADVANRFGTQHAEVEITRQGLPDLMSRAMDWMDDPVADPAFLANFALSELATDSIVVAMSGEGADEVFAGYDYYSRFEWPADWRTDVMRSLLPEVMDRARATWPWGPGPDQVQSGFPLLCGVSNRRALIRGVVHDRSRIPGFEKTAIPDLLEPLGLASWTDMVTWLPDDLLIKLDRSTMAWSLEARAPFLSHKLVEWGLYLPSEWKFRNGEEKAVLRSAFRGDIPSGTARARKQGLVFPLAEYFRGPGGQLLREMYTSTRFDFIRGDAVIRLIDREMNSVSPNTRLLYALLVLGYWVERVSGLATFPRSRGVNKVQKVA
jgi:asparagine synthase (glutamine-hydrolysing)